VRYVAHSTQAGNPRAGEGVARCAVVIVRKRASDWIPRVALICVALDLRRDRSDLRGADTSL
jgi:hypothetical protein